MRRDGVKGNHAHVDACPGRNTDRAAPRRACRSSRCRSRRPRAPCCAKTSTPNAIIRRSIASPWTASRCPPRPRPTTPVACASPACRPRAIRRRRLADPDTCIEIMTGAMLPRGCDAVVPVEQVQRNGEIAEIGRKPVQPWQNVHRRGSDCPQGALLLSRRHAAVGARSGDRRRRRHGAPAGQRPTNDRRDLHRQRAGRARRTHRAAPGAPLECLRHHRRLRQHGFARVADDHVRDDEAQLTERLGFHLRTHDVLILSGGVSMGKLDLVPKVLEKLGVSLVFHHVAQRPGKADVVRRLAIRPRRVRAAGQSGVDAGLPVALRAARAARRHGPGTRRSAAHRAHRAGGGEGAARVLHAGETQERRLGPHVGRAQPHQWLRAISPRSPAPTDSSNCRRGPTRFRKDSWRASSAGERAWTLRENIVPV